MHTDDLRIALFSGNYNITVDGANKALNRLVGYLLRQGAQVLVYSPTVAEPGFPPTGDLVICPRDVGRRGATIVCIIGAGDQQRQGKRDTQCARRKRKTH